ncbi:MAG TPA: hypothetical protein VK498_09175 [Ferruginibacter sp.]|nr:hypothetical protein [Ferruginibacter sp.]
MKKILKSICLLILPLLSFTQNKKTIYWIPEIYLDSISTNGIKTEYDIYLKPIENIVYENGKYYVQTYRGMLQPLISKTKSLKHKTLINELSLNHNYFTLREIDSIKKLKYYMTNYSDSIILEVHNGAQINHIKYIKEIHGYMLEEPRITIRKLVFHGKYEVFNFTGEKIEAGVEINLNGEIRGSSIWNSYNYKRVLTPDQNNRFYDLIELRSDKNRAITKLAIIYDEVEKSWICYKYQVSEDKYTIRLSSKFTFRFKKLTNL